MRRDLVIVIDADTGKVVSGLDRSTKATRAYEREMRKLERQQARVDAAMTQVGRGMLVAGAAIAAGLGLAVKAAIDWESSWAGVLKTVDGTDEQMAALEKEIRGLTEVLPASHAEIAAVAEAAGQLGIQRENVAGFTKVMIDMGESTNLAATEAATALARMMNIMQTAPGDVDRLGSSIVALGNSSATTEAEIVEMALRLAGAGNQIGLSESDVLSYAAALSSVGIAAESGGTAVSRVFLKIEDAVRSGGDKLETFARTAGMTAEQFTAAYRDDAAAAISQFVAGLGKIQAQGGDVNAVLSELGLSEIRVSDALRRLSGSGDLLTRSLQTGSRAWQENTALTEEAERRYGTVEARLAIARNQVHDFAISMGQTFLPAVGAAADKTAALAGVIGGLPGPLRTMLAVLALVTAGLLLAGGAALVAVPKIHQFRQAMDQIAASGGRAAVAVGAFRSVSGGVASFLAGPWGIALGVAVTALTAYAVSQANARAKVKDLSTTLDEQTGAVTDNTRVWLANELANRKATGVFTVSGRELNDFTENLERANVGMDVAVDAALGEAEALDFLNQRLEAATRNEEELGKGIGLASSERGKARAAVKDQRRAIEEIIEVVQDEGGRVGDAQKLHELLNQARGEGADSARELTEQEQRLVGAFEVTADTAGDLAEGIKELDDALDALFVGLFDVEEAQDAAANAMRRLTEEAADNGAKLDGNGKAALSNRDNVRALIRSHLDVISTMAEAGAGADELTRETEKLRLKFVEQMRQAGFSEEAIERYAEAYDQIPSAVSTSISTPGLTAAERNARNLKVALDRIPRRVDIDIHQSITAPSGSGKVGFQHGGEVQGPPGVDRIPIWATNKEIIIRPGVAQMHREQLLALNRTGRWPVGPGGQMQSAAAAAVPGHFTASAVIDLGEGIRRRVDIEFDRHDRELDQMVTQGTGAAR
jgi:TP901 family phage tail tape measure protein